MRLRERRLAQIPAVEMEQVEGVEDKLVAGALGKRVLQAEKRLMPFSSSTTISPSITACLHGSLREGLRQVAVAFRPVEAACA